jgi:hypothetical protein
MPYLLPAEYIAYGLDAETEDQWLTMASSLIEAHCRRPSLMITQYVERMRLTSGAQSVRLSYRPLAIAEGASSPIVGVRVRFGHPRRGEMLDVFRQQIAWAFSMPGSWSALDLSSVDVNQATGELTFTANWMGLDYNEVEVTYTSGFTVVPDAVKVACAQIVRNAQATPALNVKSSRMDTMQMQYFSGALIDPQVQALLRPCVAERLG